MYIKRHTVLILAASIWGCLVAPVADAQDQEFVEQISGAIPKPAEESLGQGAGSDPTTFVDGNTQQNSPLIPAATETATPEPEFLNDNFFDAEDVVPPGEMTRALPTEVDPAVSPGSKLIIVKQNHSSVSKSAQLVSAERAMSLGRYDSAMQMFDWLYEQNKKDKRVLMGRAITLQKLGRYDEAMQTYDELLTLDPKNLEVRTNMLGLLSTRYPSVALRNLLELHDEHRSNVGLTAQIAVAYASLADIDSALKYLGIASSMEPENAGHVYNMAIISDRAGRHETALGFYEKALEADTIYGGGRSIPRDAIYVRIAQIR